jgi:WbqC-like protein family
VIAVILQPSYIPWRGYFDQIQRAELFIFYDDVQYDKHGWRNRNQIKTPQGKRWLTIPVHAAGATHGVLIKDVRIDWSKPWAQNHLKTLAAAYGRAPHFKDYLPLLESFYSRKDEYVADFVVTTTMALARELGLKTRFMRSSELEGIQGHKTDRLIEILRRVGADHYISGPAAREYVDAQAFAAAGIRLEFMQYNYPEYPQLYLPFDSQVTVLDLLFMTGKQAPDFIVSLEQSAFGH